MTPKYLFKPARLAGSPLLATQSDERLVDLARAGSEPAFDAIVSRYRGPLIRYCSSLVGHERADDAVQQTFVNAFNAMNRNESKLDLKPWLYRIAHNASLNALRDRAPRNEPLDPEHPGAERPDQVLERRERFDEVLAAVHRLPERQRDAIVLRELEGRSYDEIALALGVGGGAVRALLNRARNSVRLAATAVTPVGLLMRIPPGTNPSDGIAERVAELTAGAGAGALASKLAATALVTAAVAGGVALAPGPGDVPKAQGEPDQRQGSSSGDDPTSLASSGSGVARARRGRPVPGPDMRPTITPGKARTTNLGVATRILGPATRGTITPARAVAATNSGPGDDHSGPGGGENEGETEGGHSGPGGGEGGSSGPGSGEGGESENSGPGSGESGSGQSGSGEPGRARANRASPARARAANPAPASQGPASPARARANRAPASCRSSRKSSAKGRSPRPDPTRLSTPPDLDERPSRAA